MKHPAKQGVAILLALFLLLTAFPLGVFAGMDDPVTVKCGGCQTTVTLTTTKEATCTQAGSMKGTCPNCGKVSSKTIPALGHTAKLDENQKVIYYVSTEAACEKEGVKYAHCARCDAEMTDVKQVIPALAHEWVATEEDAFLKNEAYCQAPKTYYKHCSKCGKNAKDYTGTIEGGATFAAANSTIDMNNHINVEDDPEHPPVAASCTKTGWTGGKKCKDCKAQFGNEVIGMTSHVAEEGKEATCKNLAVCKSCGATFGELDPTNHKNVVVDKAVPATCDKDGLNAGTHCADCNTVIVAQTVVPKKSATGEHTYGAWEYPANYTCEEGGIITRTCTVCGFVNERKVMAGDHIEVEDPAKPATCTETGLTAGSHCERCNRTIQSQETTPALNHDFSDKTQNKSNGNGTHSFKCTRSGCDGLSAPEACVDNNFDCICDICKGQLAHQFTTYVYDGNATCVQDGTKTAICDICKKEKHTVTDVDSHLRPDTHNYKFVPQNDETCLQNAHEIGTCTYCGNTITREIEGTALDHDPSDWIYAPTYDCEVGGLRYKECKRCGSFLDTEDVKPTSHTEVADPAVPVTCTTDGMTAGSHCSVCKKILVAQTVVKHEGHKAEDSAFKVVKEPTCTENGSKEAVCVKCGQTFAVSIDALDHDYEEGVPVAATCTENGYTGHKCKRCDYVLKDNIVKAAGHKPKQSVRPAEWGKNGKIVSVCTVCGEKTTTVISKIKSIKLSETTFVKDGKAKTPTVTVKDAAGKTLKKNRDYKVTYPKGRKNLGTYTVTITFIGNYAGTKTRSFQITIGQATNLKATAKQTLAALSWSKVKYATKYIVYCASTKDGKYKKVATTTNLKYTVTNLKANTVYYFKVKAVRVDKNGQFTGAASDALKVKTKKAA